MNQPKPIFVYISIFIIGLAFGYAIGYIVGGIAINNTILLRYT